MSYMALVRASIGRLPALLTNHTVSDSAVGSPVAATFSCDNTGQASYSTVNSGSGNYSGEYAPGATGSLYEIRWTNTSGSPTSGSATGSWLSLGTSRSWTVSRASAGTTTCVATVEIRNAATGVVLTSATITIGCTYS